MGSIEEISQLCRLCLIKDQVNVPIFDETSDINETFVKINSCLPVKVSPDDNLPKKICDGCSYKLDMLYIFRNTSAESEQQLVAWLDEAGLASCGLPQTSIKESNTKSEILVKQEAFEATDPRVEDDTSDAHSYILQQQKLPYQQEFTFVEATASGSGLVSDEPPLKRPKRAAALKKISVESEDLEATMQITKAEDDDSDDADQPDYIEAPSTSADDQPGPSGVEKGTIDAPCRKRSINSKFKYWKKVCDFCDRRFENNDGLKTHIYNFHTAVPCELCGKQMRSRHLLKAHERHHSKKIKIKCDLCDKGFYGQATFKQHYAGQHEGVRHICETCGKSFLDKHYFDMHVLKHTDGYKNKVYNCTECDKTLTSKNGFTKHMGMHRNTTFVCDICGKSVTTLSSLNRHKMVHTGEKPYMCETCGKCFNARQLLVRHERIHTKEKPHHCKHCDKKFSQRSTLVIHMRTHTGEKPYTCTICQKKFVSKSVLRTHSTTHGTALA